MQFHRHILPFFIRLKVEMHIDPCRISRDIIDLGDTVRFHTHPPAHQTIETKGPEHGIRSHLAESQHIIALLPEDVHSLCPVISTHVVATTHELLPDKNLHSLRYGSLGMSMLKNGDRVSMGLLYGRKTCIFHITGMTDGVPNRPLRCLLLLLLVVIIVACTSSSNQKDGDDDENLSHCCSSPFFSPVMRLTNRGTWSPNVL